MLRAALFTSLLSLAAASTASAQTPDERHIRQGDQNVEIRGRVNQVVKFAVTGQLTDKVTFRLNGRTETYTMDQLRHAVQATSARYTGNKMWTIYFAFDARRYNLVGGHVTLTRNGRVLDKDLFKIY